VPLGQTEQVAHFVSLLTVHFETNYSPALHVEQLPQTALADFVQARVMRSPGEQVVLHRVQTVLFLSEQALEDYYPEAHTEQFEQTVFCESLHTRDRYSPELQFLQPLQMVFSSP